MIDNLGDSAKLLLARAARISTELRHYYIGTEHLFLAAVALGDPQVRRAFAAQAVDLDEAAQAVRRRIGTGPEQEGAQLILTPRGAHILEMSIAIAGELNSPTVEAPHILLAVLEEGQGVAARTLVELEVDPAAVITALRTSLSQGDWSPGAYSERRAVEQPGTEASTGVLEQFGRDLTQLAHEGRLQPIIGRESEVLRVIQILMAKHKANPILVGDAGVGKTAIVEGLAQLIAQGTVPPAITGRHIRSIEMGVLLAGTMYRGQFEERLTKLIEQATKDKNTILFIDEIHTLIGTGAGGSADTLDAANILKPALSRGTLRCIGTTTYDEYRQHIQKDPALERRFQPVYVDEPSNNDSLEILRGLKDHYEGFHGVHILEEALVAAVELGVRYVTDRRLPDKAVDIIDQSCTKKRLDAYFGVSDVGGLTKDEQRQILARGGAKSAPRVILVTADDVRRIVSTWTHIPIGRLTATEGERLLQLEGLMCRRVIGQDAALTAVAKAIRKGRSGLGDPRRPVGVFLFLGPTGVGKTEVARALAEVLFDDESRLVQIDMSELHDRWAISRLIGSSPGLVDSEQGGQLTEAVKKQPYSVVLFDEIEKAHPDVLHLLLQLMEEGRLTDGLGRAVSFRNAVLIMTSNLGSAAISGREPVGFSPPTKNGKPQTLTPAEVRREVEKELKRALAPEFLNRIDAITVFNPLTPDMLEKIAGLMLARIAVSVQATPAAVKLLVDTRYDPALGARPLRRTIEDLVVDPLAEMLIRGRIRETDTVLIGCRSGRLTFRKKGVRGKRTGGREHVTAPPAHEPPRTDDWTMRLTMSEYGLPGEDADFLGRIAQADPPLLRQVKANERQALKWLAGQVEAGHADDLDLDELATQIFGTEGRPSAIGQLHHTLGGSHDEPTRLAAGRMMYSPSSLDESLLAAGRPALKAGLAHGLCAGDLRTRAACLWAVFKLDRKERYELIAGALTESNEDARFEIVRILGFMGDRQATPVLMETLARESSDKVRSDILWALGTLADPAALQPCIGALEDRCAETRGYAAWALGQMKDPAALSALHRALTDPDPEVRKWVEGAIRLLESPKSARDE